MSFSPALRPGRQAARRGRAIAKDRRRRFEVGRQDILPPQPQHRNIDVQRPRSAQRTAYRGSGRLQGPIPLHDVQRMHGHSIDSKSWRPLTVLRESSSLLGMLCNASIP